MYVIRILSAATVFTIILLEIYSGVIQGPTWWVLPGGLVLGLLIALWLYAQPQGAASVSEKSSALNSVIQLVVILAVAFGMSYFSNYYGREFIPNLLAKQGWTAPDPWPPYLP